MVEKKEGSSQQRNVRSHRFQRKCRMRLGNPGTGVHRFGGRVSRLLSGEGFQGHLFSFSSAKSYSSLDFVQNRPRPCPEKFRLCRFVSYPRSIVKCNTCKSWKELFKILA